MDSETHFNTWALVELFGHQRIVGQVSEQVIAGAGFVRVDVPAVDEAPGYSSLPAYTRMFGPTAIYGITPLGESEARRMVTRLRAIPIEPYMIEAPKFGQPELIDNEPDYEDDEDDG